MRKPLSKIVAVVLMGLLIFGAPRWSGTWSMELLKAIGFLLVFTGVLGRLVCTLHIGGKKTESFAKAESISFVAILSIFFPSSDFAESV
ncbi:MAG: hypothetical protein EAZ42_10955 [Verrucomicrobia bacterium]|nr:MAG: hypothetical protein EAZ42_10955 [Verrucomicrobiota bacterium]